MNTTSFVGLKDKITKQCVDFRQENYQIFPHSQQCSDLFHEMARNACFRSYYQHNEIDDYEIEMIVEDVFYLIKDFKDAIFGREKPVSEIRYLWEFLELSRVERTLNEWFEKTDFNGYPLDPIIINPEYFDLAVEDYVAKPQFQSNRFDLILINQITLKWLITFWNEYAGVNEPFTMANYYLKTSFFHSIEYMFRTKKTKPVFRELIRKAVLPIVRLYELALPWNYEPTIFWNRIMAISNEIEIVIPQALLILAKRKRVIRDLSYKSLGDVYN